MTQRAATRRIARNPPGPLYLRSYSNFTVNPQSRNSCHCPHTRGKGVSGRENQSPEIQTKLWPIGHPVQRVRHQGKKREKEVGRRHSMCCDRGSGPHQVQLQIEPKAQGQGSLLSDRCSGHCCIFQSSPMTWSTGWPMTPHPRATGKTVS